MLNKKKKKKDNAEGRVERGKMRKGKVKKDKVRKLVKKSGMPKWGELVLCTVHRITPFAAWCKLDEYPIEGMIHVSEVAGKWVKDIRDFVKINKQYVAKVIRIDYQKQHVNISLKRVSKFDKRERMNAYRRERRAEKMLERAAKQLGKNLEQAYEEVGFLLQKKFGELFVAFEEAKENPEALTEAGVPNEWAGALQGVIEKSFKKKEITIKAELMLTSEAADGIERIKAALATIEESTGAIIKYISAPKYRVELKTKQPKAAEKKLKEALDAAVKQFEGSYKLIK